MSRNNQSSRAILAAGNAVEVPHIHSMDIQSSSLALYQLEVPSKHILILFFREKLLSLSRLRLVLQQNDQRKQQPLSGTAKCFLRFWCFSTCRQQSFAGQVG